MVAEEVGACFEVVEVEFWGGCLVLFGPGVDVEMNGLLTFGREARVEWRGGILIHDRWMALLSFGRGAEVTGS